MNDKHEVAAAYARQSTHKQERSIPDQVKGMKEAAEKAGRPLPDDLIFTDENSGTTEKNRTGMAALKKAALDGTLKARGVTHLYYWATDRVARNLLDSLLFEAEMARAGIKCLSVSEGYDVDTLGGKMAFTIRSLLAEAQNKRRAADIRRGQRSAVIDGKYIFEPPYGYTKNADKRLCINIPQAAVIRRMFNLLLSGQSPRQITRTLNELNVPSPRGKKWQHAHVGKVLRQETFAGIIVHGLGKNKGPKGYTRDSAIVEPFHHPAILDWDMFVRAQQVLDVRSKQRRFTRTVRHFYLLGGLKLLHCGVCGRAVLGKRYLSGGVNYFYYKCMSRSHTGQSCGLSGVQCRVLDEIVLGQLEAYASDRKRVEQAWAKHHKDISPQVLPAREEIVAIDHKLRGLRQRKERMAAAFAEAEVALPVLKAEVKKLTDEEQRLENRRHELQQQIGKISKTMADGGILDKLADFRKTFDGLTPEGKKLLIRSFVESVSVKAKDQFEIKVRFLPQPLTVSAAKPQGRGGEETKQ